MLNAVLVGTNSSNLVIYASCAATIVPEPPVALAPRPHALEHRQYRGSNTVRATQVGDRALVDEQIKNAWCPQQLSMRGERAIGAELAMVSPCHDLLKLIGHLCSGPSPA